MSGDEQDQQQDWQRLDKWLWCARLMKTRSDCVRLVAAGSIRINRQVTDKAHARLRVGDVLTLPLANNVRVMQVLALAARRGPAPEARSLYRDLIETSPSRPSERDRGCNTEQSASYADAKEA